MSTDLTPLIKRLTTAQVDALFPAMAESQEDRADAGLKLCTQWGIKTSRTAVHECFKRHYFGWRLERGAWAAKQTGSMPEFDEEKRKLIQQKLFAEIADVDCPPKFLAMIRSLEIEQGKLDLATRSAETRFKLETEKLTLADRRVKLLEAKFARVREIVDGAKQKGSGGLTRETLEKIERELKLI